MQDKQNGPGSVFKPGDTSPEQPVTPQQNATLPEVNQNAHQTETNYSTSPEPVLDAETQAQSSNELAPNGGSGGVEWTASEFIANQKNGGWFGLLIISCLVLAGVVYALTRDIVSTVVIVMLGVIVGIFANHKPRSLTYRLDASGIHIGEKSYPYTMFKSFSVGHEHAMSYISLMPLKRFMPPISIHYAPQDEEVITDTLADYLPFEEHKQDVVDKLTKKFRF